MTSAATGSGALMNVSSPNWTTYPFSTPSCCARAASISAKAARVSKGMPHLPLTGTTSHRTVQFGSEFRGAANPDLRAQRFESLPLLQEVAVPGHKPLVALVDGVHEVLGVVFLEETGRELGVQLLVDDV